MQFRKQRLCVFVVMNINNLTKGNPIMTYQPNETNGNQPLQ